MPKTLITISGVDVIENDDGTIEWSGKADIDNDGSGGNPEGDPDFQNETSLKRNGVSLNAEIEYGVVIPESMINLIAPRWLGSQAYVTYNGNTLTAVVHDFGPPDKIGEITVALARALNIPDSPRTGGVSSGVSYKVCPGVPAIVDTLISYNTQKA